jgi:hypothetical protein
VHFLNHKIFFIHNRYIHVRQDPQPPCKLGANRYPVANEIFQWHQYPHAKTDLVCFDYATTRKVAVMTAALSEKLILRS